jgi:hypothetical protein
MSLEAACECNCSSSGAADDEAETSYGQNLFCSLSRLLSLVLCDAYRTSGASSRRGTGRPQAWALPPPPPSLAHPPWCLAQEEGWGQGVPRGWQQQEGRVEAVVACVVALCLVSRALMCWWPPSQGICWM